MKTDMLLTDVVGGQYMLKVVACQAKTLSYISVYRIVVCQRQDFNIGMCTHRVDFDFQGLYVSYEIVVRNSIHYSNLIDHSHMFKPYICNY